MIETAAVPAGVSPRRSFVCWRVELIDAKTGVPLRVLGAGTAEDWEGAGFAAFCFVAPATQ